MGNEIRWELKVIPAEVRVMEHVRYKYSCRHCERDATTTNRSPGYLTMKTC